MFIYIFIIIIASHCSNQPIVCSIFYRFYVLYQFFNIKILHSRQIWRIPYQNAPKGISVTLTRFYGLRLEKGFMSCFTSIYVTKFEGTANIIIISDNTKEYFYSNKKAPTPWEPD